MERLLSLGPAELTSVPFDELTLPDGLHTLSATVSDTCGNTSSAFGYEPLDGVESPTAITFTVDTVAPVLTLTQPVDGFQFNTDSDLDESEQNIQLAGQLVVDPAGPLEEGQEIRVLVDGSSVKTDPENLVMGADGNLPQSFLFSTRSGIQSLTVEAAISAATHQRSWNPLRLKI